MGREFEREIMLIGEDAVKKLAASKIIVFGVGGVGGYVVESLARSGIGHIDIVDDDQVNENNINRQIIALHSTIGRDKVEVVKERILDINPDCKVETYKVFFMPEKKDEFDFSKYDYVVDAVDTVKGKIEIIKCANDAKVPVISSMGAGNKIEASAFEVADIYKTTMCPLAKVMRKLCKDNKIKKLKVVYSKEKPMMPLECEEQSDSRKAVPGSVAFVPSSAGLIIAGEVIKDLIHF